MDTARLALITMTLVLAAWGPPASAAPAPLAARVEILVPGSVIQAVEGIDIGPDGMIYGTSIHSRRVYRIDPASGLVTVAVESPYGESDDVAVGPKGSPAEGVLAWTAQHTGEIRIQRPGGMPIVLMPDVPRVNPIAFTPDGRLFTAQSNFTVQPGAENALWELDVIGNKPPRLVAKNKGRLNGFGFGPDGRLYSPHFGTNEIFAIDVDEGTFTVIAEGVGTTAAVKPDANGNAWNVDYMTGDLWITDIETGQSRIFANFPPPLDNLSIAEDGTIYLASLADSAILGFNPKTGERWDVTVGHFTVPLGLSMTTLNGKEAILAADPFGYRFIDPETGVMTREPEMWSVGGSSSAVANDDILVTTYSNYGRIRTIDRRTNEVIADSTAVKTPRGVALTSAGEAIIADADGNRLIRVVGEEVVEVAAGLKEPIALLLENDTTALVTEVASGTISRVDLTSGRRTEVASGLHDPLGIARLPDGRVVVVQPGGGKVLALDLGTGERTVLAYGLPLSINRQDLPENTPLGITVARDGAIYVSCGGDNSIVRITL